jgi:hypothetical protein
MPIKLTWNFMPSALDRQVPAFSRKRGWRLGLLAMRADASRRPLIRFVATAIQP